MSEAWRTVEELDAARDRFEAELGWERPAAFGIASGPAEDVTVRRVNVGGGFLPGVVLATVLGHRGGTSAYQLAVDGLDRAIELLAPAEACTAVPHPNLAALRELRAELGPDGSATVIFVADLGEQTDNLYVRALLDAAGAA
ncbi:hypothetical protein F4553_007479 [Allocatelliglobosispora scoriae]|uniref:Uncharacterized protein n=1 Tax=Allocatelliglobosispora scoriae TaxID=643052 RepID=A0A841C297_9ACTN|nr:hypothetical protein [Allocatelliglobosispora scoriae]MBB5874045.1 hypothetical protein [Allocatelliglobosispora scoriae]